MGEKLKEADHAVSDTAGADSDSIRYINIYESDTKVYTRKISGYFQKLRRYTGIPLILGFMLMPWFVIDGRPAMLFDLPTRQFHILWVTFGPQDGMLLAWLLIIAAFGLFTVTALLGRVWCGFTCPQTVWTLMFIWAEHFCEGDRNKRMKLDRSPWSLEKVFRKSSKHALWLLIAFITGATFIGYFLPIRELLSGFIPQMTDLGLITFDIHPQAAFWTLFFAAMTYLNAGWMREQVCKYMCPYARFQSVMYDEDTLAVHYDTQRGETRGPRKPGEDYKAEGKGDCIDCSWCVQVCPVDIDIREGLQYECINCGLCVDACNAVMDKMEYPRGLVRFTSEDQLKTGATHYIRPRIFGYMAAVLVMASAFVYTIANRQPVTVDVSRDRGVRMYRISGSDVQNVYTIAINNMDRKAQSFIVEVDGPHDFRIKKMRPVPLEEGEIFSVPVRVLVNRNELDAVKTDIVFTVRSTSDEAVFATETATFIGPEK